MKDVKAFGIPLTILMGVIIITLASSSFKETQSIRSKAASPSNVNISLSNLTATPSNSVPTPIPTKYPCPFAVTDPRCKPSPTPSKKPSPTPSPRPTPTPRTFYRVFLTSQTYQGNMDGVIKGLTGADTLCQASANSARLEGIWKAWLSDGTDVVYHRLNNSTLPYVNNVHVIANNWNDLTDGSIQNPIIYDENGIMHPTSSQDPTGVWTGTQANGEKTYWNCGNWTDPNGGGLGETGTITETNSHWTVSNSTNCSIRNHLYCFEQP
jgi:hypothetical protein